MVGGYKTQVFRTRNWRTRTVDFHRRYAESSITPALILRTLIPTLFIVDQRETPKYDQRGKYDGLWWVKKSVCIGITWWLQAGATIGCAIFRKDQWWAKKSQRCVQMRKNTGSQTSAPWYFLRVQNAEALFKAKNSMVPSCCVSVFYRIKEMAEERSDRCESKSFFREKRALILEERLDRIAPAKRRMYVWITHAPFWGMFSWRRRCSTESRGKKSPDKSQKIAYICADFENITGCSYSKAYVWQKIIIAGCSPSWAPVKHIIVILAYKRQKIMENTSKYVKN